MPKILITDPISGHKYWKDENGNKTWEQKDPITGRTYRQEGHHGKREFFNNAEDGGNKNILSDDGAHTRIKDEFGMMHSRGPGGKSTAEFTSPTGYQVMEKRGTSKKSYTQRHQEGFGNMFSNGSKKPVPNKKSYGFATSNDTNQTGGMGQGVGHSVDKHSDKTTVFHSHDGKTLYIADKTSGGMFSGNSGGMSNGNFSMFSSGNETTISVGDSGGHSGMADNFGFSKAKNAGFTEDNHTDYGSSDGFSPQNLTTGFNNDDHGDFFSPSNIKSGAVDIDSDKSRFNYGSGMFGSYTENGDGSPF